MTATLRFVRGACVGILANVLSDGNPTDAAWWAVFVPVALIVGISDYTAEVQS